MNHFTFINFDRCTTNVIDSVGDCIWEEIKGEMSMDTIPNDLTGVTVSADATANVWGTDTEVRSAGSATKPFRIIGYFIIPNISQLHKVRFSSDGGSTYFDEVIINTTKQAGEAPPSGTEYIFNKGTQIMASVKAESGGSDTIQVWLKIQEI